MQPIDAQNTYSHSFLLLLCYFKRSRSTTPAMWITSILSNNLPFQLKWIDLYSNLVSQHPDSTANLQNITFNLYNSFTCDVFFRFILFIWIFLHLNFFHSVLFQSNKFKIVAQILQADFSILICKITWCSNVFKWYLNHWCTDCINTSL